MTTPAAALKRANSPADLVRLHLRIGNPDHAAADAVARVAGRLRLQVVGFRVHDDRASDDRILAVEREHVVDHLERCISGGVGLQIAKIAGVTLWIIRTAVLAAGRVEVAARALTIGHRAIAKLMNVETMLAGLKARELAF